MKMLSAANLVSLSAVFARLAAEAEETSSLLSADQIAHYLATGIVTIINLLVAYLILKFALFKRLMKIMRSRKEAIAKSVSDAEEKERLANYKFFTDIRNKLFVMEKENVMLQKQASTDSLTGLGNRYGLNKYADAAFERHPRRDEHQARGTRRLRSG